MSTNRISKKIFFKIADVDMEAIIEKPISCNTSSVQQVKDPHYHFMYELFFIQDSPLTLHTADSVSIHKNCLLVVPPFCIHSTSIQSVQRILFTFSKTKNFTSNFSKFINSLFSAQNPFEISLNTAMSCFCNELSDMFYYDAELITEKAVSALKLLFFNIYTNTSTTQKKPSFEINESYFVIIDEIISDFSNRINLKTVADAIHLSTKQTSRIIKKNYKKSLPSLLNEKRLTVAAELLLRSNKTIPEIVEYINFSSESYFYSQFKKKFGCTPTQYKKIQSLSK